MSDFKAKMHKIRFPLGLRSRPSRESLQRSPDLIVVFKGPTSKERTEEEEGRERGGKEKGNGRGEVSGGEGSEREGLTPQKYFCLEPPLRL